MKMYLTLFASLLAILVISGCGPNRSILESANRNTTPAANAPIESSSFEQDLEAMKNAEFTVIFVIRRKDGLVFDAEDRRVVRDNTGEANRRVSAEEGKAVIVGSNFPIAAQNMKPLHERFVIEDHSSQTPAANTNSADKHI